jgi:hypothetical protein
LPDRLGFYLVGIRLKGSRESPKETAQANANLGWVYGQLGERPCADGSVATGRRKVHSTNELFHP